MVDPRYRVAVIIPVYNEAENIGLVLQEIQALPPNPAYALDILVVDGGSKDATVAIAQRFGARVVAQRGKGYGAACFTGYQEAQTADILLYLDGDYSDPPAAIPLLLEKMLLANAGLGLGSRTLGKIEKGALPAHAVWGNRLTAGLIGLIYRQNFSDLPSFKAIRREILTGFAMQEMTYGWTVEMLVKAARCKCHIIEVGVNYRKRSGGKSKVSGTINGTIKAGYYLLKTALRYRNWQPSRGQGSALVPVRGRGKPVKK
jgi:glycosyltransferase involved in cell wall biosynthesis